MTTGTKDDGLSPDAIALGTFRRIAKRAQRSGMSMREATESPRALGAAGDVEARIGDALRQLMKGGPLDDIGIFPPDTPPTQPTTMPRRASSHVTGRTGHAPQIHCPHLLY